jgi:cystathionine beta-lyase
MIIYDFDTLPDRRATESGKWSHYPPGVIPLWVADMDFVSPEPVIQALRERVEHGVFGYPAGFEDKPTELVGLRNAVLNHLQRHFNWQPSIESLVFNPGVVTGLNLTGHAFARPNGAVLVQTPAYPPFLKVAQNTGVIHQECMLAHQADGTYEIDWDALEQAFTPQTRLFILCSPHNPTGRVWQRDELERIAETCLRHKVVICSDEIHCDLVFPGARHIPFASLDPEIARHTITFIAPSKTYNLAGLGCSVAIISDEQLRKQFIAARQGLVGHINLFGLVAAEAAYNYGQEWLDQLLVYLKDNRDFVNHYVKENLPGITMVPPEATYLAWLDCSKAGIPGDPYEFFLNEGRVALNCGTTFGGCGEGFARLNFGCPRSMLAEGLEKMKYALEKVQSL